MKNKKKGFTLVELIVVLAILAILAAMLVPALTGYIDKANEKKIIAQARQYYIAAQTVASDSYASNKNITSIKATGPNTVTEIKIDDNAATLTDIKWDEDFLSLAEMKDGDTCEFSIDKNDHTVTQGTVVSGKYKATYKDEAWIVTKS